MGWDEERELGLGLGMRMRIGICMEDGMENEIEDRKGKGDGMEMG